MKKCDPYPLEKMNFKTKRNTICEVLRRTFDISSDEQVRFNIRIAISMAKKMGERLHWYRKNCSIKYKENGDY